MLAASFAALVNVITWTVRGSRRRVRRRRGALQKTTVDVI